MTLLSLPVPDEAMLVGRSHNPKQTKTAAAST
jgi:hypothetical protein